MRVLEIGCGTTPTVADGWVHLDARELPHIEHVQSCVDLGNFADGSFDLIVAKDVIEHLSWRDVPKALREWWRVLDTNGHLEVETPNAAELVDLIANPQSPGLQRWRNETDWERFCRVTFGHQDYPENAHLSYFTKDWLVGLLIAAGFRDIDVVFENLLRFRLRATR